MHWGSHTNVIASRFSENVADKKEKKNENWFEHHKSTGLFGGREQKNYINVRK